MKGLIHRLRGDEQGGAMVETAFALPVLLVLIWGIFQFGIAMHANAGMQNALGEGARFATLCLNPTLANGCARPTNDQIVARINSSKFHSGYGTWGTPTVTPMPTGTTGQPYVTLAVSYTMPTSFIMFPGPTITFSKSKRVYTTAA
jgi:Flp pilus assembly protein TadG